MTTTERFGKYWSMVFQDNRILALDQKGVREVAKTP